MIRSVLKSTAVLGALLFLTPLAAQAKGKTYGHGVKLPAATSIEQLSSAPTKWLGKEVRVDGVVTNVCAKAGCWMELSDAKTGKGVRFKVTDGEIVFPMSARGHKASAEGTFEEVVLSADERKERELHAQGSLYQVRTTGAVID